MSIIGDIWEEQFDALAAAHKQTVQELKEARAYIDQLTHAIKECEDDGGCRATKTLKAK
jgi:hypothetical protein